MKYIVRASAIALILFILAGCGRNGWQTVVQPTEVSIGEALKDSPVTSEMQLVAPHNFTMARIPEAVRPCCAVGNSQKVQVAGLQVPLFRYANTLGLDNLGAHAYEAGVVSYQRKEPGARRATEGNGQIYTLRGGFIDLAHVRDTADNTIALFQRIFPNLGESHTIPLPKEIGKREIRLTAFDSSELSMQQRLEVSAQLAARQAYFMAEAHELAQWHGYRSWKPWSEAVSAYSFEDLYSNMLGAKIAYALIINNLTTTRSQYNQHMTSWLHATLEQLGAVEQDRTDLLWDVVDGHWWDSREPLPNKFMLLKRHYQMGDSQSPYLVPGSLAEIHNGWPELKDLYREPAVPLQLRLPRQVHGYDLDSLASQWLWVEPRFQLSFSHIAKDIWGNGFTKEAFGRIAKENRRIDQMELQKQQSD